MDGMPTLLHVDSSMRTAGSRSRALSDHFARNWQQAHPDESVIYRGALTETLTAEVLAADEIVIGVPLYNFGAPSTLKAWIDRIVVPGLTVDPAGAGGLAGGRRVTVTAARGGGYGPGTPREGWDHRDPWLAHALNPIGIDDVRFIHTELTMARESPAMSGLEDLEDQSIADAHAAIDALCTPSVTEDLAA